MKFEKIIPLALALTAVTVGSAGAAEKDSVQTARLSGSHSTVITGMQGRVLQQFCEKYGFSLCGRLPDCPIITPDQTPDTTPDIKPDETPDTTPDETPDPKPDETPDVTPDETPAPKPDAKPDETPDSGGSDQTQGSYLTEVVRLVNAERAKQGLGSLTVSGSVQAAAQVRAKETAQSFSHTRPNGSSFSSALTEQGVSYRGAGENIAYGQSTPAAVMSAWMNSSGHRANILNGSYTTIGVGYTVINGTPYWSQLFTY